MREKIVELLKNVEKEQNVTVLFAVENGSANNGFCEPEEAQGFDGNFSPNLSLTKNTLCEP